MFLIEWEGLRPALFLVFDRERKLASEGVVGAFGGAFFDHDFGFDQFDQVAPDGVVADHG